MTRIDTAVALTGITKAYGDVVANDDVSVRLRRGSIHALMGENGAGKSTLMSVLFGLERPDTGTIEIDGVARVFSGPHDAIAAGIGMVHQHFRLFDSLSVVDNVVLGAEPKRRGLIDRAAAVARVQELSERYGLETDPRAVVGRLSAGARQRVEILKALHREARVLILDEPTAVLTPAEVEALFRMLRRAATAGTTIVIVTHKIHEVLAVSDEVTVMRAGAVSARFRTDEVDADQLVEAMTGRVVETVVSEGAVATGDDVLEVTGLRVERDGVRVVDGVDLRVRGGEIVGVAGVSGNGQHDLVAAIVGRERATGRVRLRGGDVSTADVATRRERGLACIPEDRRGDGTAVTASVADNLVFGHHRRAPVRARLRGWLALSRAQEWAAGLIREYGVRTGSSKAPLGSLSGGNAQKVVVARELSFEAALLIAEQPTQGVDVGAIEAIHRRMLEYRSPERGVLLVSHEISELLALADRILVMYRGRIVTELSRADATAEAIGAAMAGIVATERAA